MPSSEVALTARYVFPVSGPPLEGGCVTIEGGRITSITAKPSAGAVDLGDMALLPGFVNAHTHLEFSDCPAPLGRAGMPLPEWIRLVIAARRSATDPAAAIARGLQECAACGTTAIGEISTAGWSEQALASASAELVAFYESIGLAAERVAERLADANTFVERVREAHAATGEGDAAPAWRGGLSPHAPYSVHPELVVALAHLASSAGLPMAMHLAESREELELLATGAGAFRDLLVDLGAWDATAIPHGTRVMEYLRILAASPRSLVIHGNYLDVDEIEFVAMHAARMSVVYCPRTHAYFGHDRYPLARLLKLGAAVALGTDSRASNPDLSLLAEMRHVAHTHPEIAPAEVLRLGTAAGAAALGLAEECGTIERGKWANFVAVRIDPRGSSASGAGGSRRDPHELLFEEEARVASTFHRGRLIDPHGRAVPGNLAEG